MMIRKMTLKDLEEVLVIEKACFNDFWNKNQYLYELNENPYAHLWVLVDDQNKIIGFYDLWLIFEQAEIANIAVLPAYQHKGYGNQLMKHLLNQAKQGECETVSLEVRVSNSKAISLYEKYDFSVVNIKPGYYKDDKGYEDAYFMMKGI